VFPALFCHFLAMKNIGLVGCAHIHTPGFVKAILNRPDLKVIKVWDPNPARSQKRVALNTMK